MSTKQARRARKKLRRIEASGRVEPIHAEAVGVQWIEAAEQDGQEKPKRFSMVAYSGGPMQVSSYGPPVVIDLAGLTAKAPVPILRDHELSRVVGHADEVEVGEASLKLTGVISGAGPDAAEVVASAGRGFPWKASVGARPDKLEFVGEGVTTKVNGKQFTGPLYVARKSTLGEVSFVALGADRKTSARVAASSTMAAQTQETPDMKFEQWVQALGLVLAELREDQVVKLRAKYDAEVKAAAEKGGKEPEGKQKPPEVEVPQFDIQAIGVLFAKFETAIEAKAAEYTDRIDPAKLAEIKLGGRKAALELKAKALDEKWCEPRFDLELLKARAMYDVELIRAERPKGPAIHSSTRDASAPVIEAALCRSAGLREYEKQFKPEVLEAADRGFRNLGLQECLLIAANANGYCGRQRIGRDNVREVLRCVFPAVQASSVSTVSVGGILSNVANKMLLDGFNIVPQTWRMIATTRPVSDFKTVKAYRLTANLEYEELGPSGKIAHGTLGEEEYEMSAKTYAKMLGLTREHIINDDMGAFDDLRTRLGMGAALKRNKVFWTLWVNNSAFFTLARGNYQEGADTALGDTGLASAVVLFRQMKGPDNNLLGLEPSLLLVPPALEATARKFYTSQEIRDTTASTKYPVANIYQNRFKPVVVPELSNDAYTGYSATAWYLLADPQLLATAVMVNLNGVETPTIESAEADFNTLGIQFRGFDDFGAAMSEWRAGVKSKGSA